MLFDAFEANKETDQGKKIEAVVSSVFQKNDILFITIASLRKFGYILDIPLNTIIDAYFAKLSEEEADKIMSRIIELSENIESPENKEKKIIIQYYGDHFFS